MVGRDVPFVDKLSARLFDNTARGEIFGGCGHEDVSHALLFRLLKKQIDSTGSIALQSVLRRNAVADISAVEGVDILPHTQVTKADFTAGYECDAEMIGRQKTALFIGIGLAVTHKTDNAIV